MIAIFNVKSYFKFLNRNKLYTAVTIFGFAASLMFVVLALYMRIKSSLQTVFISTNPVITFKR